MMLVGSVILDGLKSLLLTPFLAFLPYTGWNFLYFGSFRGCYAYLFCLYGVG